MKRYLDYNASTPLDERVLQTMMDCLASDLGNPSSMHHFGRLARARLDSAREQVAALVGAQANQVIFTGGGTEANNLALHAVTQGRQTGRLAVSGIEHPSVLEPARALTAHGWELDPIDVDHQCCVRPEFLLERLHRDTRLVSVMAANNETGALQDIERLAEISRSVGAIFHCDAIQAAGKMVLDFESSGVQLMTLSAHKIYGPKGVGALIVDNALELSPLLLGGGQERGLRAGTENLAAIVGFGAAAELAMTQLTECAARARRLRDRLESGLAAYPEISVFAKNAQRLPNTVQLAVAGIDGETLLMQLDRAGIAVSSGSACASGKTTPSHVQAAMGVDSELARGAIRVSMGRDSTESDIDVLLAALGQQLKWIQKTSQAAGW